MRLTKHTDYALRALIFAASHDDRLVSTEEISDAYGISVNHLVKIVNNLGKEGFLEVRRGRSGGLRLGRPASEIGIGAVVRACEPDFALVECLEGGGDACPITPACALIRPLIEAKEAFLAVLDRYTLADVVGPQNVGRYRRLLRVIIEDYDGGPVGVETLAAALGEPRDTIEDVYEPYLLQQGYIGRTPRGRVATRKAFEHLGLKPPKKALEPEVVQSLLDPLDPKTRQGSLPLGDDD